MRFEVYKRCGRGWTYKGILFALDSAKVAGQAGFLYGHGSYKIRPEDSRDNFICYRVS